MTFTTDLYEEIRAGAQRSAARIVPLVYDLVRPRTVTDIGCGEGWIAREFAKRVERVVGCDSSLDGVYVEGNLSLLGADLTSPSFRPAGADLAVCLEVAEHLPEESADALVRMLCTCAPVVLFSAAIPGQGGHLHLNEQYPDYWARRFLENGLVANEDLRGQLWDDDAVEVWYRQNLLLFAAPAWMDARGLPYGEPYAVVHPVILEARLRERDAAWAKLRANGIKP